MADDMARCTRSGTLGAQKTSANATLPAASPANSHNPSLPLPLPPLNSPLLHHD